MSNATDGGSAAPIIVPEEVVGRLYDGFAACLGMPLKEGAERFGLHEKRIGSSMRVVLERMAQLYVLSPKCFLRLVSDIIGEASLLS